MSKVIQFLEKIAVDKSGLTNGEWQEELQLLDIDPELKSAILNKDQQTIEKLLGCDTNLMCVLFPAEEEPSDDSEDTPEKEKEEQEARRVG
jgi:hypothetical protein